MLLFSMPWAYVADTHGRKPLILLLTLGLFIKYPYVQIICYAGRVELLKWTWLSVPHTLCGGSVSVATGEDNGLACLSYFVLALLRQLH